MRNGGFMIKDSAEEMMLLLYKTLKICDWIGSVIICISIICYVFQIIKLKKRKNTSKKDKTQAKENLKLRILAGGTITVAAYLVRLLIRLGEEVSIGKISKRDNGWIPCLLFAIVCLSVKKDRNNTDCDDKRNE